jgi:large conductance mechanosensitive channel
MHGFIEEFKAFAMKGNVVDLAVAVIIGAAFGKIVSSLVDNIVMPLVGILLGGIDLTSFTAEVGEATIAYGIFLQSVIDFLIIALAIFVAIKAMQRLERKEAEKPEEEKVAEPSEEVKLLREIRDGLRRGQ